ARTLQADEGSDSRPFSIRRLIAFANATHRDLMSVEEAWQITTLSRLPANDRAAMHQAIRAHFDDKAYIKELKGEVLAEPAPAGLGGSGVRGRQADVAAAEERRQAEARRAFSA